MTLKKKFKLLVKDLLTNEKYSSVFIYPLFFFFSFVKGFQYLIFKSLIMIKVIISLIVVLSIGLLIIKNKSKIGSDDACLCTEILVNENFTNKKVLKTL